jgi:mono/diheme cytochrome c family protein
MRSQSRLGSRLVGAAIAVAALVGAAPTEAQAQDKKIARTYKAKCASCHGAEGKADTETGKKMDIGDMTTADFQSGRTDAQLKEAITAGVNREKNGKKQEMASFKDELKPDEVDGLVSMVRSFGKK